MKTVNFTINEISLLQLILLALRDNTVNTLNTEILSDIDTKKSINLINDIDSLLIKITLEV